jgi:hypothetical protein
MFSKLVNSPHPCSSSDRVARFFLVQNTKMGKNIPKDHKFHQMDINIPFGRKRDKMAIKIPTSSIARPSKIYPKWDFWFENIPSGNTGLLKRVFSTFSVAVVNLKFVEAFPNKTLMIIGFISTSLKSLRILIH